MSMVASKGSSSASSAPAKSDGFYLQPRTKVLVLAVCFTLMIAASVYAVLQGLNPDPQDATIAARIWYPHETNPYARLQSVRCTPDKTDSKPDIKADAKGDRQSDDYACRLNSIAVVGSGNLPELWAVGNFGLVLHRPSGQTVWEQLTVTATEEIGSPPLATPTPTPTPAARSNPPTPTPAPRVTPIPTPTPRTSGALPPANTAAPSNAVAAPLVSVPDLIGLGEDEARKTATFYRLSLQVEYEKGSEPNPTAQQAPPRLRVTQQSPAPKTQLPPGSTITITLGTPRSKARLLLDQLVPTVYAAEPDKAPRKTPQSSSGAPPPNASKPPQRRPDPAQNKLNPAQVQAALAPARGTRRPPLVVSALDDDLIFVNCSGEACRVLGRSGRIYRIGAANQWTFVQGYFKDPSSDVSLLYATSDELFVRSGGLVFSCPTTQLETVDFGLHCTLNGSKFTSMFGEIFLSGKASEKEVLLDPIPAGTSAALRAYAFTANDDSHAYMVGDHGAVISATSTGRGVTWRHETQGPEGAAPNHRLPALWYWAVAFLLIITCSVAVAAPPPPPPTELSVADWTVTDAPLKPGDVDSLNFTPMALGLSRFIRNPKTQPPVTIAVEGEWGEGKSSVMGLLRGDLEKSRYRPVWFNAWHHQSEEQLLAALLEHIKEQGVPPWWHIDNWVFRARLLLYRFRGKWPLLILLVLALCGSVAFELSRHGLKMDDFAKFGKDTVKLIKYLLPWSSEKELPDDIGHFSLVATMIAIFTAIFKKARAFGINPAKLTDNLHDAATIKDIKPDPGVRPRFAREFGDLCKAWSWGGRRVIIFIDDLDRCRPESVVTVLESINFLTTAGDCMIVLGMAQKQVTHCVGLGFKDIAHAEAAYKGGGNTEQEKAVARYAYGEFYIKKLVNIVAPLPKTTPEQRRRVLEVRAAEAREAEEQKASSAKWRSSLWDWASQCGGMIARTAPVIALMAAIVLSVLIGYKEGIPLPPPNPGSQSSGNPSSSTVQPTASGGGAANPSIAKPLVYSRPASQPATLIAPDGTAGGVWWSYAVDALFLFVLFGILAYQLSARTNLDAQNSPDFEDSLKLWGQYIVGVCDTPREIKRTLNDLRYLAMTRRTNGPSSTRVERLIRTIRQLVTGRTENVPIEARVDEAALPPLKAAELASLTDEERARFLDLADVDVQGSANLHRLIELKHEHIKHFGRWIGEARIEPPPDAPATGSAPPAKAAGQG